ncbi:hypothetical protein [Gelidibacter sp.]|uniref:hypothetical protein n=1 Tax=Gelidibacter sp. TaxID=2018083 RepID=UPI002C830FF5|nr:hypothetical protein [Gelidibacter sp.]HUH28029.1 hypothetical protein [Gelidibacter sp.]
MSVNQKIRSDFFPQSILLSLPVVKNKKLNSTTQIFRKVLASALLIMMLFSSCSIKRGIKALFDIPHNTVQVGNFATQMSSMGQGQTACLKCADFQILTADSFDHSLIKKLSPAIFISLIFSLLLLPFVRPEEEHNYKLPILGSSIPKYLLFGKLLFYDIR